MSALELIVKKRTQDLEVKRKENLALMFDKRKLELELSNANRKISNLNKDIQTIHSELNLFAETFESKLEAAISEKDSQLENTQAKLEELEGEANSLRSTNQILEKKLLTSNQLLSKMASSLRLWKKELEDLKTRAETEIEFKNSIQKNVDFMMEQTKEQILKELESEVSYLVGEITLQRENEFDRIHKDNIHLTKEMEALRHEINAEETLGLSERLIKVKKVKEQPKLFTQTTLMLDFPKLFDDLVTNSPEHN